MGSGLQAFLDSRLDSFTLNLYYAATLIPSQMNKEYYLRRKNRYEYRSI
jgi:hypothetical protein